MAGLWTAAGATDISGQRAVLGVSGTKNERVIVLAGRRNGWILFRRPGLPSYQRLAKLLHEHRRDFTWAKPEISFGSG